MTRTAPRGRTAVALLAVAAAASVVALPAGASGSPTPARASVAGPSPASGPLSPAHEPEDTDPPDTDPPGADPADADPLVLDDLTPARLTPDDSLRVTVTVTAPTDIDDGLVTLAMSPTVPISRSLLTMWQAGTEPSGLPLHARVPLEEPLAAGESVTLGIELSAVELGLREWHEWGPRGVEIQLRDGIEILDLTRTVVVWREPDQTVASLPVGLLVPVTSASVGAAGDVPGLAAQDPAETAARVHALAGALAGTGTTVALDPLLLDRTAIPLDGPLTDLARDDHLLAVPVGDADLAALAHLDRGDLAARLTQDAVDRITQLAGLEVPAVAWPVADEVDLATVDLAYGSRTAVTVLTGNAVPLLEPVSYTVGSRVDVPLPDRRGASAPVLVAEERLSSVLTGRLLPWNAEEATELTPLQSRQLLLAELAVILRERPADPRPLLLAYDRGPLEEYDVAATAQALADAPWVTMTPLPELTDLAAPVWEREELPRQRVDATEVTAEQLEAAEDTEELAGVLGELAQQPPAVVAQAGLAVRTVLSADWRDDPAGREELVADWRQQLQGAVGQVRVTPTSPINLISATAELPVRVVNEADFDAVVRVLVEPDDPRLVAPDPVTVTVPAGGGVTAQVPVRAIGSGDLPVDVRLETVDGRPMGEPSTIVVRVRAGWEGYGVVAAGVALALLFGVGLVRRIRRGVRVPTGDATPVVAGDPGAPVARSRPDPDRPEGSGA